MASFCSSLTPFNVHERGSLAQHTSKGSNMIELTYLWKESSSYKIFFASKIILPKLLCIALLWIAMLWKAVFEWLILVPHGPTTLSLLAYHFLPFVNCSLRSLEDSQGRTRAGRAAVSSQGQWIESDSDIFGPPSAEQMKAIWKRYESLCSPALWRHRELLRTRRRSTVTGQPQQYQWEDVTKCDKHFVANHCFTWCAWGVKVFCLYHPNAVHMTLQPFTRNADIC